MDSIRWTEVTSVFFNLTMKFQDRYEIIYNEEILFYRRIQQVSFD